MQNQYDAIYEEIASEMETGKTEKGLWIRLFAECNGDEQQTKVLYIKRRAEKLISAERTRLEQEASERAAEAEKLEKLRPPPSDAQQMVEYGITFDGERYINGTYKYEKLSDAINYAKIARTALARQADAISYAKPQTKVAPIGEFAEGSFTKGAFTQNPYEAILGEKNRIYYLTKFEKFDQQGLGLKASWNWPAFLCGGVWALYRKMYGWFFAFWGVAAISNIFEKAGSPGLGAIIFLAPWIAFTIYANSLYHNNVKKKIAIAQLTVKDESKLHELLRYKGGVHTWVIWVSGLVPVIGILAAILIPMFARH